MRRTVFDNASQGPIWLGYRLGHIQGDSRIFRAILYNKGALVLHMLRSLVGDETFFRGVRELYTNSRFTKIGTEEVRATFEKVSGQSLEVFFERWVHESTIPTFRWTQRTEGSDLVLTFAQATTPETPFSLPVPVTLTYVDGSVESRVLAVTGPSAEERIPLPKGLRSVAVDPDGIVLARFAAGRKTP